MYKDKIFIAINHSKDIPVRKMFLYENGDCQYPRHKKIIFSDDIHSLEVYKLSIICSSSKDKLIDYLSNQNKERSALICFKGSDSDFLVLKESVKKQKKWNCLLIKDSLQYIVNVYWDSASKYNYFCNIVSIEEKPIIVQQKSAPVKEEKKDVDVNLQEPDNDKKTD